MAIVVAVLLVSYMTLRRLRAKNKSPKYLPGGFLKKRWQQWQPKGKYRSVNSAERGESMTNTRTEYQGREETAAAEAVTAGVNRNTSVRSVMTLPAYSQAPKETERVLGREGERGGMDTVVEFPETAEEEEATRETEMESLYQIRQARRREIAEREERRRERREARERGDVQRLEELRRESRQRVQGANNGSTGNLTADTLIAEHQSRPKERRVSSVAYGEVGQVRHDGTRVRANSHESERGGLLAGAAPMGENAHGRSGSDATSLFTIDNISRPSLAYTGGRHRSDSGALSVSTASSIDLPQATPIGTDEASQRPTSGSSESSPADPRFTPEGTDRGSDENGSPSDGQPSENRLSRPPEYDNHDWGEAPSYEEALRRAQSQRQSQLPVPRINVQMASEPNTPVLRAMSEEHETER